MSVVVELMGTKSDMTIDVILHGVIMVLMRNVVVVT